MSGEQKEQNRKPKWQRDEDEDVPCAGKSVRLTNRRPPDDQPIASGSGHRRGPMQRADPLLPDLSTYESPGTIIHQAIFNGDVCTGTTSQSEEGSLIAPITAVGEGNVGVNFTQSE
jgi:hypothetical protein